MSYLLWEMEEKSAMTPYFRMGMLLVALDKHLTFLR